VKTKREQFYMRPSMWGNMEHDGGRRWYFDAAMVDSYEPLYHGCESNYEVEIILRREGVLKGIETDTETCALVLNVYSAKTVEDVCERYNAFVDARLDKLIDLGMWKEE